MTSPPMLTFLDRRRNGVFPVLDTADRVVATISPSFWVRKFTAHAADGSVLCAGRAALMTRSFDVTDGEGRALLTLASVFMRDKRRVVRLADGSEWSLRGERWPSRDWAVTGADDNVALSIVTTSSSWSFHPDAYAVQVSDPRLTLAHVVGIVASNRILVKSARQNHGGAAGGISGAAGAGG